MLRTPALQELRLETTTTGETMTRYVLTLMIGTILLLSACTRLANSLPPNPDAGTPASKRFIMTAEGNDALLGPSYTQTFEGNAAYAGSLLQLWSDSITPNRILKVAYFGGGVIPVGSYRVVGREADVTDPQQDVVVTYTLAQGAFCTVGCDYQGEPVPDYYFEYYGTDGTVTISQAGGGKLVGELDLTVQQHSYHANLDNQSKNYQRSRTRRQMRTAANTHKPR